MNDTNEIPENAVMLNDFSNLAGSGKRIESSYLDVQSIRLVLRSLGELTRS
jgi:hypothetical protein